MSIKSAITPLSDLDADFYSENSSLQNSLAMQILEYTEIDPTWSILDVGCGDGKITAEISKRAFMGSVLGIDASENMISFASKIFSKNKYPNLDFTCKLVEQIRYVSRFDLIVSFSCFHWIKEPKLAVKQLSKALKPGGEMLVITYPKESPYYKYLEKTLLYYPKYKQLSAYQSMLSSEDYRKLFKSEGLDLLTFEQEKSFATYNSIDEVISFIHGWLYSYVPLPPEIQNDFLLRIGSIIEKDKNLIRGDKIQIPYISLLIKTSKI